MEFKQHVTTSNLKQVHNSLQLYILFQWKQCVFGTYSKLLALVVVGDEKAGSYFHNRIILTILRLMFPVPGVQDPRARLSMKFSTF